MLTPYQRPIGGIATAALVVTVVLAPLLGTLLLAPELRSSSGFATVTQLVVFPAVLGASILLYVQHRLTGSNVLGWACLCLTQYSVQGVALGGLLATERDAFVDHAGWVLIIDVPAALLILGCLRLSDRVRLAIDPLATGLLLGLLVAGANLAANHWGAEFRISSPPVIAAQIILVVVGAGITHAAYQLTEIPRWLAVRLALGVIFLVTNRVASAHGTAEALVSAATVVAGVMGAVLMVSAAGAGLREAVQDQHHSLLTLSGQVAAMVADERDSRARLHEITNSIASIAVASSLIHQEGDVPSGTRRKLERMLESEATRLSRILGGKGTDALSKPAPTDGLSAHRPLVVDLDDVIGPLVTAQEALGRPVQWEPTGHWGLGDPDAVAEVVNILLDNSAQHAPDSWTTIHVTRLGDTVEVAVHDEGPGIPAEVRAHLFEWGSRGPDSLGQGIGLHLAQRLMTATGNSLRLESQDAGNTFVISLPAAEETL